MPSSVPFEISGTAGEVILQDAAHTGICHRREDHGAYLQDSTLTFWIAHMGARNGECKSLGVLVPYRATVGNVSAGEYLVRVEYIGHISTHPNRPSPMEERVTVR